jgi:hypothetical protein
LIIEGLKRSVNASMKCFAQNGKVSKRICEKVFSLVAPAQSAEKIIT